MENLEMQSIEQELYFSPILNSRIIDKYSDTLLNISTYLLTILTMLVGVFAIEANIILIICMFPVFSRVIKNIISMDCDKDHSIFYITCIFLLNILMIIAHAFVY